MSFQTIIVLPTRSNIRTPMALISTNTPSSTTLAPMPSGVSNWVLALTKPGK